MNALGITLVLAIVCLILVCGLLVNMFLYSRALFRYRRVKRKKRFDPDHYEEFYTRPVTLPESDE